MKIALKYGLFFGLFTLIVSSIMYMINGKMLINSIPAHLVQWLSPLVFMGLACRAFKKENDGILDLGEGIRTSWVTYVIGSFIGLLVTFVIFNYVNPDLKQTMKEEMAKISDASSELGFKIGSKVAGASESAAEIAYEQRKEEAKEQQNEIMEWLNPYSFKGLISIWLMNMMTIGFIYSLIVALIMKKKRVGP